MISVRARDAANNVSNTTPINVTVANLVSPVGLVAAWGFDDTAGPTATDSSGHAYNGTASNTAWTTAGKFGGALAFNGVNSWVTVADNNAFDLTNAMTLEAWIKPDSLDRLDQHHHEKRTDGLAYALYASDDTGNPPAGYISNGVDISTVGTSPLTLGAWVHLATTYDGANLRLYVNGLLVASRAVTDDIPASTDPIRIGGDSIWGEYFDGLIDEVRVYTAPQPDRDSDRHEHPRQRPKRTVRFRRTRARNDQGYPCPTRRPIGPVGAPPTRSGLQSTRH